MRGVVDERDAGRGGNADERGAKRGALAGAGAVIAAVLASACCIGPLALGILGLGGAAFASQFEPLRPYFLALTAALLGFGFNLAYRPRKRGGEAAPDSGEECCAVPPGSAPRSRRSFRAALWVATLLAAGAAAIPYVMESGLRADAAREPRAAGAAADSTGEVAGSADAGAEMSRSFACDIGAMDAAQRARHAELGLALRSRALGFEELPDGFAIRFPADPEVCIEATEFLTLERLCCPFLDLGIELERDGGPLRIRMTGPAGVKPFLRAELGLDEAADAAGAAGAAAEPPHGSAPPGLAPHAPLDSLDLGAFRDEFNRASPVVRVVALLSPT